MEDILDSINLPDATKGVLRLIENSSFSKIEGEPLAPWIATPYPEKEEWPGGDVGTQYNYWGYFTASFWQQLSLDEKVEYFIRYDLGADWKDRGKWFSDLFEFENDDDYERLYAELEIG